MNRVKPGIFFVVVLLGFLSSAASTAADSCTGSFEGRQVSQQELADILREHYDWLTAAEGPGRCVRAGKGRANLCGADLSDLSLVGANLMCADLQGAKMNRVVARTLGDGAFSRPATFAYANLRGAWLMEAQLQDADFLEADLSGAVFIAAQLNNANFGAATLTAADLSRADVTGVLFEPKPGALPTISRMTDTRGLAEITFVSPHAVAELREALKKPLYASKSANSHMP